MSSETPIEYEFWILIRDPDKKRIGSIMHALAKEQTDRPTIPSSHWHHVESETGSYAHVSCSHACLPQQRQPIAQHIADKVWAANRKFCKVHVNTTVKQPNLTFVFSADKYKVQPPGLSV